MFRLFKQCMSAILAIVMCVSTLAFGAFSVNAIENNNAESDNGFAGLVLYLVPGETTGDKAYFVVGSDTLKYAATAITSETVTSVNTSSTGKTSSVAPVYDVINGVKEDKGGMFDYQFNSGLTSKYAKPNTWTNMPANADVRYVGTGEHSKYYVYVAYVEYEKNPDGSAKVDENGNYIIKELRRYDDTNSPSLKINGEETTTIIPGLSFESPYDNPGGSRPFMFAMMDRNGQPYYGYCCDLNTPANTGFYYTIANIEDSSYYASDDAKDHIRSIVMNGYWGTTGIPNEDGSYAFGSLELIKQKLIAYIDENPELNTSLTAPVLDRNNKYKPVVDENGEVVMATKTMKEMVMGLTSGEALLATQAAVWSYANGSTNVLNGKDASIVLDPDGYKWNKDAMGSSKTAGGYKNGEAMDDFASAAVDFFYSWLVNLDTNEESSTVINEKNFIENIAISLGSKIAENGDNDTYLVDLSFDLGFAPGESDDLRLELSFGETTIEKQLTGANADITVKDGRYYIEDLELTEGEANELTLHLVGKQYLEHGAYVYLAHGGREKSQNFVGVAEGEKRVDVSKSISFSVETEKSVVPPVSVVFEGEKYLNGLRASGFDFALEGEDGIIEVATSNKNGVYTFSELVYSTPGSYEYTVYELIGNDETIVYDDREYSITVEVERVGDELVANVSVEKDGLPYNGDEDDLDFRNHSIRPTSVTVSGEKYLDGQLAEGFKFALEDANGNVIEATSDKNGYFEFNLDYSAAGEYTYEIYEIAGDDESIIYDGSVYEITVSVTLDGTKLSATVSGAADIVFNNETVPEETTTPPEETTTPPEETTTPPEETTTPPEETTTPPEETTAPPEETTTPPEETTTPPEETTAPPEETTTPPEETTTPPEETTEPTPETTEPEPEESEDIPEETTNVPLDPTPETTEPAPETTESAPETTEPETEETENIPEDSTPLTDAPTTTEPDYATDTGDNGIYVIILAAICVISLAVVATRKKNVED